MNTSVEKRSPLSETDIERIADAVAAKTRDAFHIEEEVHYNSHKKLDTLLTAYDTANNIFWKTFLALVIVGSIVLAGIAATKGVK